MFKTQYRIKKEVIHNPRTGDVLSDYWIIQSKRFLGSWYSPHVLSLINQQDKSLWTYTTRYFNSKEGAEAHIPYLQEPTEETDDYVIYPVALDNPCTKFSYLYHEGNPYSGCVVQSYAKHHRMFTTLLEAQNYADARNPVKDII